MIAITVEMTEDEAAAAAEFLKRCGFAEYRACAASEADAYRMRDAMDAVRQALADAGHQPR